jgi:hypothetical protein
VQASTQPNPTKTQAVNHILRNTDWNGYWQEVSKQTAKEVEAYADARAKSYTLSAKRVIRQP